MIFQIPFYVYRNAINVYMLMAKMQYSGFSEEVNSLSCFAL